MLHISTSNERKELNRNLRVGVINRLLYIIFVFSRSKPDLISKKPLLYANFSMV